MLHRTLELLCLSEPFGHLKYPSLSSYAFNLKVSFSSALLRYYYYFYLIETPTSFGLVFA